MQAQVEKMQAEDRYHAEILNERNKNEGLLSSNGINAIQPILYDPDIDKDNRSDSENEKKRKISKSVSIRSFHSSQVLLLYTLFKISSNSE